MDIIEEFLIGGRVCQIVMENRKDYESDYYKFAIYDKGKRKFGLRKMRNALIDVSFINSVILKYRMENGETF